jgi:hypothetical protein
MEIITPFPYDGCVAGDILGITEKEINPIQIVTEFHHLP